MLSTYIRTRALNSTLARAATIAFFAALTALTARITIHLPFTPVPITLQVMVVLLAGLALGAKDGALSQIAYVASIALGLPFDANALGAAAFASPTAGYLIGFIAGAFVAGYLAERGLNRNRALRLVVGVALILVGLFVLALFYSYIRQPRQQKATALKYTSGSVAVTTRSVSKKPETARIADNKLHLQLLDRVLPPFSGFRRNIFKPIFHEEAKNMQQPSSAPLRPTLPVPPPPPPMILGTFGLKA